MLPKSSLKETQQALANAIRLGNADPFKWIYAASRLVVYTRLVRYVMLLVLLIVVLLKHHCILSQIIGKC